MSLSFTDLSSPDFAKAIRAGVQRELEASIVQELSDVVMPKIRELAKKAARDVCEHGKAHIALDPLSHELRAYVSFNDGATIEKA